jgi:hypothetical protein
VFDETFEPHKTGNQGYFHPEVLKEREQRIHNEIKQAEAQSPLEKAKVA